MLALSYFIKVLLKQATRTKVHTVLFLTKKTKSTTMHHFVKLTAVLLLLTGAFLHSSAQAITGDEIKAQFVKDWERAKSYTLDYLNTMPADKYSFKAVDSIRSFAQQMLHLASGNVGLIQTATGEKIASFPGRGLENSPTAQTKDSVVYYVTKSYDFAIESAQKLDPNKL